MQNDIKISDLSILVVEPSGMQAKIIQNSLLQAQVSNVQTVNTGQAARDLMNNQIPDLVISAMYLEDMTGTELVQWMRNNSKLEAVPFMLISSETSFSMLDPVRQAGVVAILPKPFEFCALKRALYNTLDFINPAANESIDSQIHELNVLIVDDSRMARKHIRRVLENIGVEKLQEAENGKAALPLLENNFFDLVVTDYNMPEMDGAELTRYIREKSSQSSIPVLMVTSENDTNRLAAVHQSGVSGICDKPFEPDTVKAYLLNVLAEI